MTLVTAPTEAEVPFRIITPGDVRASIKRAKRREAATLAVRASLTPWLIELINSAPTPRESRVYFIQSGAAGAIKIGKAFSPGVRLAELQTACPSTLRLLGSIPGDVLDERELHARFSDDRVRGEWFAPSAKLLSFIEEVLG